MEEIIGDELRETLRIWNQSVSGSKTELWQHLIEYLEKEGFSATYTFKVEDIKPTADPLLQTMEKMVELSTKADRQCQNEPAAGRHKCHSHLPEGKLAAITNTANKQKEQLATMSAEADQQHAKLSAMIDQQQTDLSALDVRMQLQIAELWKEVPCEVQQQVQQVRPPQQELKNQKETLEKLEK